MCVRVYTYSDANRVQSKAFCVWRAPCGDQHDVYIHSRFLATCLVVYGIHITRVSELKEGPTLSLSL